MDTCKKAFVNIFLLGLVAVWTPGLFHLNPAVAASGFASDPDDSGTVYVNALVMEINPIESSVVVGEKRIFVTKLMPGIKFKTVLLDQNDGEVKLEDFKIGQRVLVKGVKLPDGAIKAETIKMLPPHPSDAVF